jgi:hypothetical protein
MGGIPDSYRAETGRHGFQAEPGNQERPVRFQRSDLIPKSVPALTWFPGQWHPESQQIPLYPPLEKGELGVPRT